MKDKEQLKKENLELEILKIVFDESDHLRGGNFQAYLEKKGKQDLGKQIAEPEEVEKKLTKEQQEELMRYEEAVSSGSTKTLSQYRKMVEVK